MEIKAQITKKLQKYKADEIKTLYQLMLRVLSGNDDFRMVQNADTDDLRPVIEGETGEKIDFAMESIISGESLKLWQDIQAEEAEKVVGFEFVWFTDGMGWISARNNLKETFDKMDNIYNIADMKNGVMNEIFK